MIRNFLSRVRLTGVTVLVLWVCLVVDVFTIVPKRAVHEWRRRNLNADQKAFERWGGFYVASKALKEKGLLGVTVGIPSDDDSVRHGFTAGYGNPNLNALLYPGRGVTISDREELLNKKPAYIILDGSWPEFSFLGDPRPPDQRAVESPQLVEVRYA